jgi:hypothetical protein
VKITALYFCLVPLAFGQGAGVTQPWDIQPVLRALTRETQRLTPILSELQPGEWVGNGAPDTYRRMHENVLSEISHLGARIAELEKDPERMTPVLEAYFRLQALEAALSSLGEGVRKYQNPALADLIAGVVLESENNRSRLRAYLLELVSTREHELKVMDSEAQRCRGALLREPPPPVAPKPRAAKPAQAPKP